MNDRLRFVPGLDTTLPLAVTFSIVQPQGDRLIPWTPGVEFPGPANQETHDDALVVATEDDPDTDHHKPVEVTFLARDAFGWMADPLPGIRYSLN